MNRGSSKSRRENELATAVKLADILDNSDPRRGWDPVLLSRYRWAWGYLWPGEELPDCLAPKG